MKQIVKIWLWLAIFALGFASCREDEPTPPVPKLSFTQSEISLKAGETAEVAFSGGDGSYTLLTQTDLVRLEVLTSAKKLKITAREKPGSVTVKLQSAGNTASLKITISEAKAPAPALKAAVGIYDAKGVSLLKVRYQLQKKDQTFLSLQAASPAREFLILPILKDKKQGDKVTLSLTTKGKILSLPEGASSLSGEVEYVEAQTIQVLIPEKNWRLVLAKK